MGYRNVLLVQRKANGIEGLTLRQSKASLCVLQFLPLGRIGFRQKLLVEFQPERASVEIPSNERLKKSAGVWTFDDGHSNPRCH